ncbi:type II secretion system minor pseudopilin GspI [Thioalkalivibrio sp. XN8]|uniref:type II secretion system minor pseudopilin GspI n=1 Tax=Thioalkalivibrio sp. XN8 TaxID=2712863 RepID=UPI0013EC5F25|nr:type II secretion system minor pseudopilin GspI [Thioalkalivibrio sp. XN8]
MRRARGFTLLEVMVAMFIVAIGLIAAYNGVIQMAHSTTTLRERAFADWIAMNQLAELRVGGEFPEVGRFDGDVEFAGREWRWDAAVAETGVDGLRRVEIAVAYLDSPDRPVTLMTGFIGRAAGQPAPPPVDWWGADAGPPDETPDEDEEPADDEAPAEPTIEPEPEPEPPGEDG